MNLFIKIKNKIKNFFKKIPAVVVVRLDGIGDYVLMHDFLYYVKNDEKYKNKKLVFIGRQDFRQLAEQYDYDIVDEFVWLDLTNWVLRFRKFFYRRFICLKLFIFYLILNAKKI